MVSWIKSEKGIQPPFTRSHDPNLAASLYVLDLCVMFQMKAYLGRGYFFVAQVLSIRFQGVASVQLPCGAGVA